MCVEKMTKSYRAVLGRVKDFECFVSWENIYGSQQLIVYVRITSRKDLNVADYPGDIRKAE